MSSSSSSSSSKGRRRRRQYYNLHLLVLVSVLCVAVLRTILQSSSVFFSYYGPGDVTTTTRPAPVVEDDELSTTTTTTTLQQQEQPIIIIPTKRAADDTDHDENVVRTEQLENDDNKKNSTNDSSLPKEEEDNGGRITTSSSSPLMAATQQSRRPPIQEQQPSAPQEDLEPAEQPQDETITSLLPLSNKEPEDNDEPEAEAVIVAEQKRIQQQSSSEAAAQPTRVVADVVMTDDDTAASEASTSTIIIPRTIYMYWEKGFPIAHLPGLQMTLRSWIYFNPGWTVKALNGQEAELLSERSRYISDEIWTKMTVQAKSDVYRTLLLFEHGGVWVDASLYCNTPLDQWLPFSNITDLYSFRRTDNPSEQKELGISPWITSWFLASPPHSYTLTKIVEKLSNPDEQQHRMLNTDPKKKKKNGGENNNGSSGDDGDGEYFWWHHLVADIANSDTKVKARIDSYHAPWHCGQKNWMSTAPILKRCANHLMFHMLATTQRCCGDRNSISSSGRSSNSTTTTTKNMSQEWQDVCSAWNCTMTTANLVPFNEKVKDLYGGQAGIIRIKSEWYKEIELPGDISSEAFRRKGGAGNPLAGVGVALAPVVVRGTAQVRPALVNTTAASNIPRIIWMFWDTGWPAKNHPGTNMNRRSWELLNPDFTVRALDGPTAERLTNRSAHVPDEIWHILAVQAKSDIYRTLLLNEYGGIWADCNVFCNRPVHEWVDLNATDIVSMRRIDNIQEQEKKGISPWITSWFLAAPKASYTISKVVDVISNPNEHYRFRAQYFWWHHIVGQVAQNDTRILDMMQHNYSSPWVCGGPRWQREATVLKRCATQKMYPVLYTSEQCCPEMGGRPHFDINNNTSYKNYFNMTDNNDEGVVKKHTAAWTTLCSQWNCRAQAANLAHGKVFRELWGNDFLNTLQTDYFDP